MATGAQFRGLLGPMLNWHWSKLDRFLVALDDAGLVRRGRPGKGVKAEVHLTGLEIGYLYLALASPRVSGAPKAALDLGGLSRSPPQAGDPTLITRLAASIDQMAHVLRHAPAGTTSDLGDADWELQLCLNPLRTVMVWPSRGPTAHLYLPHLSQDTIAAATEPPAPFRRDFVITHAALVAAARLHAGQHESAGPPDRSHSDASGW